MRQRHRKRGRLCRHAGRDAAGKPRRRGDHQRLSARSPECTRHPQGSRRRPAAPPHRSHRRRPCAGLGGALVGDRARGPLRRGCRRRRNLGTRRRRSQGRHLHGDRGASRARRCRHRAGRRCRIRLHRRRGERRAGNRGERRDEGAGSADRVGGSAPTRFRGLCRADHPRRLCGADRILHRRDRSDRSHLLFRRARTRRRRAQGDPRDPVGALGPFGRSRVARRASARRQVVPAGDGDRGRRPCRRARALSVSA